MVVFGFFKYLYFGEFEIYVIGISVTGRNFTNWIVIF